MRQPTYLTLQDAAAALGISRQAVTGLIERGQLEASRFGRIVLVPASSVERLRSDETYLARSRAARRLRDERS